MKVSTENDNNFGYEQITIVVDNIPLSWILLATSYVKYWEKNDVVMIVLTRD
jgi:hypothetical protein